MASPNLLSNLCPHCRQHFTAVWERVAVNGSNAIGKDSAFSIFWTLCPARECQRAIIWLVRVYPYGQTTKQQETMIYPRSTGRDPLPSEVPTDRPFVADYLEACAVLEISPKAAGALARRSLQNLLREHLNFKAKDLSGEIQLLLDTKTLPGDLAEHVDLIRHIGNFSAHPQKSLASGEIMDVEPGEAEWTLEVLEELFDFYFVRTAQRAAKRAAIEARIREAKPNADIKKP